MGGENTWEQNISSALLSSVGLSILSVVEQSLEPHNQRFQSHLHPSDLCLDTGKTNSSGLNSSSVKMEKTVYLPYGVVVKLK